MWRFFKYSALVFFFKKYEAKLKKVFVIFVVTVIFLFIASDVDTFLVDSELDGYRAYLLIFKWIWILAALYLVKKIISKSTNTVSAIQDDQDYPLEKNSENSLEKELMDKKRLRSRGDIVIQEAKQRKNLMKK